MRLNKYLAQCGLGSRRKCDEFISKGKIKIALNDYLNIAKSFVTTKELKMLNAIIDKYLNEKKYI